MKYTPKYRMSLIVPGVGRFENTKYLDTQDEADALHSLLKTPLKNITMENALYINETGQMISVGKITLFRETLDTAILLTEQISVNEHGDQYVPSARERLALHY